MSNQATRLRAPFPTTVQKSLNKGGTTLTYVPVSEVIARVNNVLDDFSIDDMTAWRDEHNTDWVIAKVQCSATIDGHHRTCVGMGGESIKLNNKTQLPLDLGDNFKGATSDATKKALQQWGVGLHLARGDGQEYDDCAKADGWYNTEARTDAVEHIKAGWETLSAERKECLRIDLHTAHETSALITSHTARWLLREIGTEGLADDNPFPKPEGL